MGCLLLQRRVLVSINYFIIQFNRIKEAHTHTQRDTDTVGGRLTVCRCSSCADKAGVLPGEERRKRQKSKRTSIAIRGIFSLK